MWLGNLSLNHLLAEIYWANFNSIEAVLKNQILLQLNTIKIQVENTLKDLLVEMKDFTLQARLQLTFHKTKENGQSNC